MLASGISCYFVFTVKVLISLLTPYFSALSRLRFLSHDQCYFPCLAIVIFVRPWSLFSIVGISVQDLHWFWSGSEIKFSSYSPYNRKLLSFWFENRYTYDYVLIRSTRTQYNKTVEAASGSIKSDWKQVGTISSTRGAIERSFEAIIATYDFFSFIIITELLICHLSQIYIG